MNVIGYRETLALNSGLTIEVFALSMGDMDLLPGCVVPVTLNHRIVSGWPAKHPALWGECWDGLVQGQDILTVWYRKLDLQL